MVVSGQKSAKSKYLPVNFLTMSYGLLTRHLQNFQLVQNVESIRDVKSAKKNSMGNSFFSIK